MGIQKKVVLFNGKGLNNWQTINGEAAEWKLEDNIMTVTKEDIYSKEIFTDARIHIEFRIPDMPEATGQGKGNSGIFIHGLYEIQVLDSYGFDIPGQGDCGAIYELYAPLVNACKPAMKWQSYDIFFRAPRFNEENEVIKNGRITVLQNDILIQNNVELPHPTGGRRNEEMVKSGPLMLQDHNNPVSYRNIWMEHLPLKGSDQYDPK